MKLSSRLVSLISKTKALKATLAITGFWLTTATLSIASTVLTANKASAELITSRGFGVSLNTNYNYRRIYGEPRMSVYATNPNDGDQQFDRIQGNAGWMLKHRGTGKCLNAYSKYSGAEPFVWPCNPADMDQNWEMLDKGNGYVLYRLKNTGMCLTLEPPVGNSSIVALRDCAYNGANGTQDWIGSLNPNSPVYSGTPISANPPGTTPLPTTQQVVSNTTPLYEYWIVSRKTNTWGGIWSPLNYQEVGHSFNALIKKEQENVKVYTGGALTQNYNRDKGGWYIFHTYGFWNVGAGFVTPGDLKIDNGCSNGASSTECQDVKDLLNGKSISQAGFAVRKARVGENRALWIDQNRGIAGCSNYSIAGGGGSNCNCVDYATRSWYVFTANWEDFRPWGTDAKTPSGFVEDLKTKNSDGGFLDGGKTWQ
jgi:hypothetical protein